MTGHPASGKTTRSRALASSLLEIISKSTNPAHKKLTVKIINDESCGLKRATAYADARAEKEARATFSSAVKRELTRECIVIADGMNYIKGFRYQMYCEAKACLTPSCCLHVATTPEHSKVLNNVIEENSTGSSYPADLLENLIFRFEEPSAFSRWDSPLFTLPVSDPEPPAEAIFEAIVGGGLGAVKASGDGTVTKDAGSGGLKRVQPNMATVAPVQTDAGALQRVDGLCAAAVKKVTEWQRERGTEVETSLPIDEDCKDTTTIKIPVGGFSTANIQRLRREFVGLIRGNPSMASTTDDSLRAQFVSYINRRTWEDG